MTDHMQNADNRQQAATEYAEGFVDGWEHACAVLEWLGQPVPTDSAALTVKRAVLARKENPTDGA